MASLSNVRRALVGCLGVLVVLTPALAADWQIRPRLSVDETYTDNVDLDPKGDERSDFVTRVTPGISASATGARLRLNFDYQASLVDYARSGNGTRVDHRLQGSGNAELYEDHLFLDFSATVSQRNIDNQGRISRDNISGDGNRETVTTLQVSPYWVQRFGGYADALLRYNGGLLRYSQNTDTDLNSFDLNVDSGREFAATPWSIVGRYRDEDNNDGSSNTFRSIEGNVRFDIDRRYAIRVRGGYEDDTVVSARQDDTFSFVALTGIWTPNRRFSLEVGAAADSRDGNSPLVFDLVWTPTERTRIAAGYAPTIFGSAFDLDATHTMRKAVFDAGYSEDRTTTAQREFDRQVFPTEDAFGDPIDDPGLQQVGVPIDDGPNVTNQTIVRKRFDGGVTVRGAFTTITLSSYHERDSFELTGGDEKTTGFTASASRDLSRYGTARVAGYWQRTRFEDGRKDQNYGFDLGYDRTFSDDLRGSLIYSYTKNDSDQAVDEYTENRVTARVTVLF